MSEADIGGDMRGKVGGAVAIYEAGAVADGEGRPSLGCPALGAEGERIALIMIEEEERVVGGGEVGESARDATAPFDVLMRVGEMDAGVQEFGRADERFVSANAGGGYGEGKKHVGLTERVMVEVIARAGLETSARDGPVADGDGDTEFTLDVALAVKWEKSDAAELSGRGERIGDGEERRRLIVVPVVAVQHPAEFGDGHAAADAGIGGVFVYCAGEARRA